jgi:O-antigen/teichoic acid export membrane protein
VQSYVVYWLAIFIAGAATTGVYAACVSVIFANPVVFGVCNVLTPKLAQAWQRGGGAGLRREAQKNALLLGVLVAIFWAIVAMAGESVMHLLFRGDEYPHTAPC